MERPSYKEYITGNEPETKLSVVANTWIRQMRFRKAGDRNCGHAHSFPHQTLLAKGKFRVYVEDKVAEFTAPQVLYIEAGKEHMIQAVEDESIAFCIHALRKGDKIEDIMDPDDMPADVDMFGVEVNPLIVGADSGFVYRTPRDTIG